MADESVGEDGPLLACSSGHLRSRPPHYQHTAVTMPFHSPVNLSVPGRRAAPGPLAQKTGMRDPRRQRLQGTHLQSGRTRAPPSRPRPAGAAPSSWRWGWSGS